MAGRVCVREEGLFLRSCHRGFKSVNELKRANIKEEEPQHKGARLEVLSATSRSEECGGLSVVGLVPASFLDGRPQVLCWDALRGVPIRLSSRKLACCNAAWRVPLWCESRQRHINDKQKACVIRFRQPLGPTTPGSKADASNFYNGPPKRKQQNCLCLDCRSRFLTKLALRQPACSATIHCFWRFTKCANDHQVRDLRRNQLCITTADPS